MANDLDNTRNSSLKPVMTDAFVITGSRPPSASGRARPLSGRTRSGYHKVSESANVDETLFKSHNYATHSTDHGFKYPWVQNTKEEKKKNKGPPLLWSPSPVDMHRYEKKSQGVISLRNSSTSQSSKSKHRLTRHTPTFVDESLFGEGLPEPSFESPWADKVTKGAPIYWAPQESYNRQMTQGSMRDKNKMEPYILDGRPPSRQGPRPGSFRNRPLTVESMTSGKSNSVWKP
ncbi:RBPJ-interacting and tubulin-associated protein 1-like [Mytilus galloprovincialis]|uniref:RBPJ-interacting and tubulin-associated protein 1-like n=1 Tax=Mytilus galloprovincialis TaxID=29158 RepID=UPI003F7B52EA